MSLETFTERMQEITAGVHSSWASLNLNESVVRQVMVLPLLQAAGFDIWNPLEVYAERTSAGGTRVDLAIDLDGVQRFCIELKGYKIKLTNDDIHQAVAYAGAAGIRWAILTNGQTWLVADQAMFSQPYEKRVVLRLDFSKDKVDEYSDDLYKLLSRERWEQDQFETALTEVQQKVARRKETEEVVQKKLPLVKEFALKHTISELANAMKFMLREDEGSPYHLSSSERDILIESLSQPKPTTIDTAIPSLPQPFTALGASETTLICEVRSKGIRAVAHLLSDGSLEVQPGSTSVGQPSDKFTGRATWVRRLQTLLKEGIVQLRADGLIEYVKPYRYRTSSEAATAVTGRSTQGTVVWKGADNRSYADLFAKKN